MTGIGQQPEWSSVAVGRTETRVLQGGPVQASEAVVFIHGNPGSASDWEGLVAALSSSWRAVAFDLPDFGQTVAAEGFGNTVAEYADFVGLALDALGVDRAHLVLHDFGGPIGLVWASLSPDRVASVTLINTGILEGYRWHTMARVWQTPVLGELAQLATTRQVFTRVVPGAEPRGLPREFVEEMYGNFDRRTRAAVLRLYRDAKDLGEQSSQIADRLAHEDHPALVIWGGGDSYIPLRFAEAQKRAFPSARVEVLPDSGHWPFVDSPTEVSHLLEGHLGRSG
jgi:pimeloyl-ACP methyl ester carboxylesterase